jgi:hypothetical protein
LTIFNRSAAGEINEISAADRQARAHRAAELAVLGEFGQASGNGISSLYARIMM